MERCGINLKHTCIWFFLDHHWFCSSRFWHGFWQHVRKINLRIQKFKDLIFFYWMTRKLWNLRSELGIQQLLTFWSLIKKIQSLGAPYSLMCWVLSKRLCEAASSYPEAMCLRYTQSYSANRPWETRFFIPFRLAVRLARETEKRGNIVNKNQELNHCP